MEIKWGIYKKEVLFTAVCFSGRHGGKPKDNKIREKKKMCKKMWVWVWVCLEKTRSLRQRYGILVYYYGQDKAIPSCCSFLLHSLIVYYIFALPQQNINGENYNL